MKPPRSTSLALRAALAACVMTGFAHGQANDPTASINEGGVSATATSEQYEKVSCTGANPALVSDVLQVASDTRDSLTPILNLGHVWRYPVHITLTASPLPPATEASAESVSVVTDGKELRLEARLSANDPAAREFIQRQFVTALLWEKFFKPDATFTAETRLDVVPVWLIEGLREMLSEDPTRNREEVVKRAALAGRAPTLAQVTGWKVLSNDRLLNLWQRAFCFYLVECLTHPKTRLADFQGWLASITGSDPKPADYLFPTEMGWQRELAAASGRDRAIFFTWDESSAEIAAAQTIALPKGKHADDTQLCTIDTVATFPRSRDMDQAINAKILELTSLELRIHPSWHQVVELYRFGLTALLHDKDNKRAVDYIHQARVKRAAEMTYHENLTNYVNWFEVTQYMPLEASHFQDYFRTAQEIDKVEADPNHPNPLRANLLKVESEF